MARIPKIPTIKPIRPIKPINKIQNIKPMPKLGQSEAVDGHWRISPSTNKYVWVKGHYRKP